MQSGDAWVAYAWQGAYATLLGEGVPVAYANPTEGRNSWVGVYGISASSPNYDLALKFLDQKLADATSANLPNLYYYGSANGDVMAGITDETLKEAFSIDDPDILEATNFTPNLTADQRDAWTAMWAEVKASQ
jgi:spermidine/putrescine transport system substrate-binding protein